MLGSGDLSVAQLLFFPQDTRFNKAEDLQACLHSEYLSSLDFCLPWLLPPEGKCLRQASIFNRHAFGGAVPATSPL